MGILETHSQEIVSTLSKSLEFEDVCKRLEISVLRAIQICIIVDVVFFVHKTYGEL